MGIGQTAKKWDTGEMGNLWKRKGGKGNGRLVGDGEKKKDGEERCWEDELLGKWGGGGI